MIRIDGIVQSPGSAARGCHQAALHKSMSSPDELTFGNPVAAIHDVDALTT
jgi:hypothetical protein